MRGKSTQGGGGDVEVCMAPLCKRVAYETRPCREGVSGDLVV